MACVQILTHLINTSISHVFLIGSPRFGFSRSWRREGSSREKGLLDLTVQLLTHWVGESKLRASLYFISDHKAGEFWWLELLRLHSAYFQKCSKRCEKVTGGGWILHSWRRNPELGNFRHAYPIPPTTLGNFFSDNWISRRMAFFC